MAAPKKNNPLENYARFTSLGIQMLVIIFLGVFGGYKLDGYLGSTPAFTIILSVAGVSLSIYYAVRESLRSGNKKQDHP